MNLKKSIIVSISLVLTCATTAQEKERYNSEVFESIHIKNDVVYGSSTSQAGYTDDLIMDIYLPEGDDIEKRPLVIFAHGGFFFFGDKDGFKEECTFLAKSGYIAVSINYRLIDIDTLGVANVVSKRAVIDAVYDMKAAVRYFKKDASLENFYQVDTSNIFIGGYSAGAITSLHYAYANSPNDVLEMGGKTMMNYVLSQNGMAGTSGNPGYSDKIKGVINISGSLHSAEFVDKDEAILFSVHGTDDEIVPFKKGLTGSTTVKTEGSWLIHEQANRVGLINKLVTIEGGDHFSFHYSCEDCKEKVRYFLFENL